MMVFLLSGSGSGYLGWVVTTSSKNQKRNILKVMLRVQSPILMKMNHLVPTRHAALTLHTPSLSSTLVLFVIENLKISYVLQELGYNKATYTVPVQMEPEPENIWDSKASAFFCNIDGQWPRIGYVVREVLDDVHEAIRNEMVLSVKFAWIKYITSWSRSGPGYYAGIDVAREGNWSSKVMASRSTV